MLYVLLEAQEAAEHYNHIVIIVLSRMTMTAVVVQPVGRNA